jgi:hypothetical protein
MRGLFLLTFDARTILYLQNEHSTRDASLIKPGSANAIKRNLSAAH